MTRFSEDKFAPTMISTAGVDFKVSGVVWCGVVWCGVVWFGVVRCGVAWCELADRQTTRDQFLWLDGLR